MKKTVFFLGVCLVAVACKPTPEKVKQDCLKNKDYAVFYGEQTPMFCDCVYGKLKEIADTADLNKQIVDSVTTDCETEYTTMDTNF
ncbi:MAG: hypothetical protein MJ197_05900 [Bacteroidales bacterium]|nr:hypothetical protein [Bacteroidales bacterium]